MIDVAELVLSLYLWLRREIQRRQRQLEELGRQAEETLRAMCRWIAENWQMVVIVVCVAFIAAIAISAAIGFLPAAVAAVLAAIGSLMVSSPAAVGAVLIFFLLNRLGGTTEPDRGPIQPEGTLTTINFPGVSITMYPQDLGKLLAGAEVIYSGSMATIARALRPPVA
jgi:hypothetical protein